MNYRERVLSTCRFEPVDELPFRHAYGLMPGVLDDWHAQGLPSSVETEKDIYEYFGFPARARGLPVNRGFVPAFETRVIEDTPEHRIAVDHMGRTVKVLKDYATLPLPVAFPVSDAASWADYKRRLAFREDRIGADLEEAVAANVATGHLNVLGGMGFYWFPRDLMGDENLCIAYYEQPELIHDILETWCRLHEQLLERVLRRVRIDEIHFGEDMAYKNASMLSKPLFDEFIAPYYRRIAHFVKQYEVPLFSVDTDGCVNELVDWFADLGVNQIGPNEVNAGNSVVAYRDRLGRRMTFDGGLDKRVLPQGPEAIDSMLDRTIPPMLESGGGWIVCLDHRVVRGTRLEDFEHYVKRTREMIRRN